MPIPTAQLSSLATAAPGSFGQRLENGELHSAAEGISQQTGVESNVALTGRQAGAHGASGSSRLHLAPSFHTDAIKRYVARQPLQSAAIAAAAGAVAMLLLRAQWTRHAESRKWSQGR